MHCALCTYYTWCYFIAFAEIVISFEVAKYLHACHVVSDMDEDTICYDGGAVTTLMILYDALSLMLIVGVAKGTSAVLFTYELVAFLLICPGESEIERVFVCIGLPAVVLLTALYHTLIAILFFGVATRKERFLQFYQTCTITLKASAIVRRAILTATEYDEANIQKSVAEVEMLIVFTLIFTLEAMVVAGACRKMQREQQEVLPLAITLSPALV